MFSGVNSFKTVNDFLKEVELSNEDLIFIRKYVKEFNELGLNNFVNNIERWNFHDIDISCKVYSIIDPKFFQYYDNLSDYNKIIIKNYDFINEFKTIMKKYIIPHYKKYFQKNKNVSNYIRTTNNIKNTIGGI